MTSYCTATVPQQKLAIQNFNKKSQKTGRSPHSPPRVGTQGKGHATINRSRTFAIKDQTSIESALGQAMTLKFDNSAEYRTDGQSSMYIIGPYMCGPRGCKLIVEADLKQPSESLFSAEFSVYEDDLQRAAEESPEDPRVHLLNAMRHWKVGKDLQLADNAFNKAITTARRQREEELLTRSYALYANFLFTLDDEEDVVTLSSQNAT